MGPVTAIHHGVIPQPKVVEAVPPHSSEPIMLIQIIIIISVHPDSHGWSSAGEGSRNYCVTKLFTVVSIGYLHPVIVTSEASLSIECTMM